jgi:hypothetical protein
MVARTAPISEGTMRNQQSRRRFLLFVPLGMILAGLLVMANPVAGQQGGGSGDQKYAGTWVGSYSSEDGNGGDLSFLITKDEKGQWRCTVKYTNPGGQQTAEFKELLIADGKLSGKFDNWDGQAVITIVGQFQGGRLEGTYSSTPKGETEVAEKGTWKVTKGAAAKTAQ